ncbi:MAG: hypothetical protein L0Y71_18195 [Gemmataceae bacterium]|nr:hypothetical protein [Gemmataceae bacterium]
MRKQRGSHRSRKARLWMETLEDRALPSVTPVFINELHYDNTGADVGEAVEVAGPAGTDLTGWSIALYNGANGAVYDTIPLSGMIDDEGGSGFGAVSFLRAGIQNGSPDGLALVNASSVVIQFLSYEGSFTALAGPANGMLSTDIGVTENGTNAVGTSLQLIGTGSCYEEFTWTGPVAESPGAINAGQTFQIIVQPFIDLEVSKSVDESSVAPGETVTFTVTVTNTGTATATGVVLVDIVPDEFGTPTNISAPAGTTATVLTGSTTAVIAEQNFDLVGSAPATNPTTTTDSLPNGGMLTNFGASPDPLAPPANSGVPFTGTLLYESFWFDTRGVTNGPVTNVDGDTSDFIGANSFAGANAPNQNPNGASFGFVSGGVGQYNYEFSDSDGRIDIVFNPVDTTGFTGRTVSFAYWVNGLGTTAYEGLDSLSATVTDGTNSATIINLNAAGLEAAKTTDETASGWHVASFAVPDGWGSSLSLTISGDTDEADENIFIEDVVFGREIPGTGNDISWTGIELAPGASATLTYDVNVGQISGTFSNFAQVTATDQDSDGIASNNDPDSDPGNGNLAQGPQEDDEASASVTVELAVATLTIDDVSMAEGDSGTTAFTFTVSLDTQVDGDVHFTINTNGLSATGGGVDFDDLSGVAGTIPAGSLSTTVTVNVVGELDVEDDETFEVILSDVTVVTTPASTWIGPDMVTESPGDLNNNQFFGAGVFINEIHYDNVGTDVGEFVEIAGPAGTDVSGWQVVAYNGNGGVLQGFATPNPLVIDPGTVIDNEGGTGFGALSFLIANLENGAPDGIALVDNNGVVIEFLSYEGVFTATAGPANGMTSTDIGVAEPGEVGESLQKVNVPPSGITEVVVGDGVGLGTIVNDDDDMAVVSIDDVTLAEGDSGTTAFTFTVSLDNPVSGDVIVDVSTNGLTAADGTDFADLVNVPVTVAAGTTSTTVTVEVTGEALVELHESFEVVLSNPRIVGGTAPLFTWIGPVAESPGSLNANQFVQSSVFINEIHYDNAGADMGEFVEIAGPAGTDVSGWQIVAYNGNGGGLAGFAMPNPLVIADGTVIDDEGGGFGALAFFIAGLENGAPDGVALVDNNGAVIEFLSYEGVLTATAGPAAGMTSTDIGVFEPFDTPIGQSLQRIGLPPLITIGDGQGLGTILNDDTTTISIDDVTMAEGNSGTTAFTFSVSTVNPISTDVTVLVNTTGLTAAGGGVDFADLVNFPVTIPAGATSAPVTVNVTGELVVEFDETFDISISGLSGAPVITDVAWTGPLAASPGALNANQLVTNAVFINEIHYDNAGTDAGEFVEIAGPAGTDVSGWQIVAYNGNGGGLAGFAMPNPLVIPDGTVIDDEGNGFGALAFSIAGLENGAPDGIALVDNNGVVIQFLSYEGVFTASDGPAAGMTSIDIGVSEPSNTPVGQSLQLSASTTVLVTLSDTTGLGTIVNDDAGADLDNGCLLIVGTEGHDFVKVFKSGSNLKVLATFLPSEPCEWDHDHGGFLGIKTFNVADVNKIKVFLKGGHDISIVSHTVAIDTIQDGGAGNDLLVGGNRSNILMGGDGNDTILGRGGRDIAIGGDGVDLIYTDGDEDILIGGSYSQSSDLAALDALMAEWSRTDLNFDQRVTSVTQTGVGPGNGVILNASTISHDDDFDLLIGGIFGKDLFFANTDDDLTDALSNDELIEILGI